MDSSDKCFLIYISICLVGITLLVLFVEPAVKAKPNWGHEISVLNNKLVNHEQRLRKLEAMQPSGVINEYHVDTAAGEMVCRTCRLEEKK